MRCPFPGMDPYLERAEIWPDFHDSLIAYIREGLQPLLRPRYVALTQDRLYVVESERPIWPDVSVVRTSEAGRGAASASAVAVRPDTPLVFDIVREEIRQPVLHIVEPAAGNRIVAAIEVSSPDNKAPGPGRESYLRKREELWQSGAHLVEVDLLRAGQRAFRLAAERLRDHPGWRYLTTVTRSQPPRCEIYGVRLDERLSRVGIPLGGSDPDVVLDLEVAFERCWDAGPYPELLSYDGDPPADLDESERAWCRRILAEAKSRAAPRET